MGSKQSLSLIISSHSAQIIQKDLILLVYMKVARTANNQTWPTVQS